MKCPVCNSGKFRQSLVGKDVRQVCGRCGFENVIKKSRYAERSRGNPGKGMRHLFGSSK